MRIGKSRFTSLFVSLALATSMMPAPALAEMGEEAAVAAKGEAMVVAASPAVRYRIGEEDAWRSVGTVDEAVARQDDDVWQQAPDALEVDVAGLDAKLELRTRADGQEWPEEWATSEEAQAVVAGGFEELQARLVGADAATYDVWYRVHVGERGWLGWARGGESAGTKGLEATVDGLQVVLVEHDAALPQDNAAAFVTDEDVAQTDEELPAESSPDQESSVAETPEVAGKTLTTEATSQADASKSAEGDQEKKVAETTDEGAKQEAVVAKSKEAESKDAKAKDAAGKANAKKATDAAKETADAKGIEAQATPTLTYQAHVQRIGWMDPVTNGRTAGTEGRSLRMEALRVSLPKGTDGGVAYEAHVQRIGWQGEVSNGADAGTHNQSLRVEAFRMHLTGKIASSYDIYYRTHIQKFGWLKWAKNGEDTGSAGMSLRMEALQIQLVPKGGAAPAGDGDCSLAFVTKPTLSYCGHVQRIGWQDYVQEGETAGTFGQSLRVEAIKASVDGHGLSGEVQLNAHVQRIGWQDWTSGFCGTSGQSLRVEAIQARLTGELEKTMDIYYRVHAQRVGWMGWAKNGERAGTSAMSLRLEAIEMRLVPKGWSAPGSTDNAYIDGNLVSKLGYQNPAGFYQVSSKNVTITSAASAPWNYVTPSRIGVWATRDECVETFIGRAQEYLGTPYMWNYSCAPGVGVDCIGLVYQCAYACGMDLGGGVGDTDFNPWAHWVTGSGGWHSHDANNFWDYGNVMHVSLSDRQRGDLISWAGHVAIYLGNDQIIEAYPGSVMYSSLWDHGSPRGCMRLFQ